MCYHLFISFTQIELEYSNDDFVSLECQAFLHELYSNSHSLCISSVICCITRSPFLIFLCPLPFQKIISGLIALILSLRIDYLSLLYFRCLKNQPLSKTQSHYKRKALELKMCLVRCLKQSKC